MKKFILLFLFTVIVFSVKAQIVNIPDANFKNALIASNCVDTNSDGTPDSDADLNNDGEIQVSEAEAVINLNVYQKSIVSMEGLQSFVNIETLECSYNFFASIDLSQNVNLLTLACNYNNVLTELDLSNNAELTSLNCYVNINLTYLDVTQNTNLEYINCVGSLLTSLDVSQHLMLKELYCGFGLIPYVDVTNNLMLTHFDCGSFSLMQLDVTQNIDLLHLTIDLGQMTSLDLSQNTNLRALNFEGGSLTSIDLSQNTALEEVVMGFSQFPTVDFSNNPNLRTLNGNYSEFTSLDLSQNFSLEVLSLVANSMTELNIQNGNNLNLEVLEINNNPNLSCVQVDDEVYANSNTDWQKDTTTVYSENCLLSIEDVGERAQISIYPNPTNGSLYIESQNVITVDLTIIDMQGRIVKTIPASNFVDVSQLTSGLYFLKIASEGIVRTKKFIKN